MSEQTAIVLSGREAITERIGKMVATIYEIDNLTNHVKGVRDELRAILDETNALGEQALAQDAALVEYQQHEQHLIASANEMQRQRDAVLDEMSTMLNRLKTGQFFNGGELEREVYNAAMETHNYAFWESLPYDLAESLGGDWSFVEARFLFDLINDEAEESAASLDLETEDVVAFREVLLEMVEKLMQSSPMKMIEDGD